MQRFSDQTRAVREASCSAWLSASPPRRDLPTPMHPPRAGSPTALLARLPQPISPSPRCSRRQRRGPSRSATRTDWTRRRPARAATREPKQAARKTTYSSPSFPTMCSPGHPLWSMIKPGEELSITTYLPGFCPAVWRPDVCRPLAALGPDPLSWSSGTLATKRFYLPFFRKTNEGEHYLVIRFTNALPFYFTISALTFSRR